MYTKYLKDHNFEKKDSEDIILLKKLEKEWSNIFSHETITENTIETLILA